MLFAPAKFLVNLTTLLPDALRPGAFLALLVVIAWFVAVQRGLPDLWHAVCRGAARVVYLALGLLLLPDYLTTTARHRRGQGPAEAVLAVGGVAERALDGAAALYARHERDRIEWKRPPWIPCLAIIVVCALPWIAMERLPASAEARQQLAKAFDRWRDVEAWADVDPSRRAAPGISWPRRPLVLRVRQRGRIFSARLRCRDDERCAGRVILRTGSGRRLHSRLVSVRARSSKTVHLHLSKAQARKRTTIRVARAPAE